MLFQIAMNLVMQNKVKSLRLQRLPRSYAVQVVARLCAFSKLFNLLDAARHEPIKFPRDTPFHPGRHISACDPGSACLKPRKVSEAARFRPIPLVYLGSQGVQFNYPQRRSAGIALGMTP